jgi:hypothetical protein
MIGALAGVGAAVAIAEIFAHHEASPERFGKDGPQVPKEFDMSGFAIKGLALGGWPVVLDYEVDSPGVVEVDITGANKQHIRATLTHQANTRMYQIFHLPENFSSKLQTAVYDLHCVPMVGTPGVTAAAPGLRVYGIGAGPKAVGSVAIDQLTFEPAIVHRKAKEVATYTFHAHSAFDGVRAEFVFTTLYNGHTLVQKDQEEKLSAIGEGERARETWEAKGKPGEHMLQVRAWRGLETGGDWVVAWSPDIVDVVE